MTTLAGRLRALFLALVFLGGGTSLPSFDVLLYHLHGEPSRSTAHVEPAGGCTAHEGHCGIGCPASAAGALAAQASTPLVLASEPTSLFRSPQSAPAPHIWRLGFDSRAPPVSHA